MARTRRPRRSPGLAALALAACFTGDALEGEPCTRDVDCGPNLRCSDAGLCGQTLCTTATVITLPTFAPDIALIVTFAASMHLGAQGTDGIRWQQVLDLVDELGAALGDRVNLGLQVVPTIGPQTEYLPCRTDASTRILPGPGQGQTIADALVPVFPANHKGEHALRVGIDLTLEGLALTDPDALRPRAIVLISDAPLNCSELATGLDEFVELFDNGLIPHVAEVAAAGVPIYVVGVDIQPGDGEAPFPGAKFSMVDPHVAFNQLADAGGRPRPGDTHYYRADEIDTIVDALAAIPPAFADCRVKLDAKPVHADLLVLRVGPYRHHGQPDCTGGHGWRYVDREQQSVELCPATCADFRAARTLTIEQRCPDE
jgi:hypothetical protein